MRDFVTRSALIPDYVLSWAVVPHDHHAMRAAKKEYHTQSEFAQTFPGAEHMLDLTMCRRNMHRGVVYCLYRFDAFNPKPIWLPVEWADGELTGRARIYNVVRRLVQGDR